MRARFEAVVNKLSKRAPSDTLADMLSSVDVEAQVVIVHFQESAWCTHPDAAVRGASSAEAQLSSSSLVG